MPYTHCSVCGAKALVGATRCPRCQAPFVSYDPKGERVQTVTCPNCGVQRPAAIGVCPNCLTSTTPAGRRLARGLIGAGAAVVLLMAVGYAISRRAEQAAPSPAPAADTATITAPADSQLRADSLMATSADTAMPATLPPSRTALPPATATPGAPSSATTVAAAPTTPAVVPPKPAPPPSVAVPDTGVWEYARANTWVRVRSAPTRDSEILRMVDSAQRVRLGPPQNGWRPVRVGVDRGWVDPRLFTVVTPKP